MAIRPSVDVPHFLNVMGPIAERYPSPSLEAKWLENGCHPFPSNRPTDPLFDGKKDRSIVGLLFVPIQIIPLLDGHFDGGCGRSVQFPNSTT
jgi:hypothetical protein